MTWMRVDWDTTPNPPELFDRINAKYHNVIRTEDILPFLEHLQEQLVSDDGLI